MSHFLCVEKVYQKLCTTFKKHLFVSSALIVRQKKVILDQLQQSSVIEYIKETFFFHNSMQYICLQCVELLPKQKLTEKNFQKNIKHWPSDTGLRKQILKLLQWNTHDIYI